ncbi:ABC transporter substrate-binding protein [Janibacter alittae]|uniref:ABC transporter substrate-binding protein n=1 Tax=Janibacter alittae TaxID=3115209 RepID=A0ABZ2MGA4_9MICO
MSPNRRAVLASTPAVLLALSACSTGSAADTTAKGDTSPSAEAGAFPVTITHAFGSTEITRAPTRIATVGWNDQDVVASFGVVPVGATKITWGGNAQGSTPWFDEAVQEIDPDAEVVRYDDADGVPVAEIATLAPDLILGVNSGLTKEEYDKLSTIAPTVAYPELAWGTPWEESVAIIGKAIGQPDEADQLGRETNRLIDDAVAKNSAVKGTSVAWASFSPTDTSTIDIYTSIDLRPQLLRRFGMEDAGIVKENSDGDAFFFSVSAEKAQDIDADVLIFYAEDTQIEDLKSDPLLGRIPAIERGSFVASADNTVAMTMSSPSPISMEVAVTQFLPLVADAAKAV